MNPVALGRIAMKMQGDRDAMWIDEILGFFLKEQ